MEKKEIIGYLNTLYLEADEDLEYISEQVNNSLLSMNLLDEIELNDYKMASWPYEIETTQLREDNNDHTISNEDALSNAADVKDGYVKYTKVV